MKIIYFYILSSCRKILASIEIYGGAELLGVTLLFPGIVNIIPRSAGSIFILSRNPRYNADRSSYNASTFILCAKPSLCLHGRSWHTACNTTSLLTRQLFHGLRVSSVTVFLDKCRLKKEEERKVKIIWWLLAWTRTNDIKIAR